jgi:hypothetical protein
MKYIVVKSILGFGDRFEALKMCVLHAITHSVPLFVDWSDETWCHEDESFYKYFSLNIPTFSLKDLPDDTSVFPNSWAGKFKEPLTHEKIKSMGDTDLGKILPVCEEDILVISTNGYRLVYPDQSFFINIFKVIDPRVMNEVRKRQNEHSLSKKWGIHLRGTDRTLKTDKSKRISELTVKLVHAGLLNGAKMVVVSDDIEYTSMWGSRFQNDSVILSSPFGNSKSGTHRTKDIPVSKDEMNVNLLIDFFTLALCSDIFSSCQDSRFAHEARRIHPFMKNIV